MTKRAAFEVSGPQGRASRSPAPRRLAKTRDPPLAPARFRSSAPLRMPEKHSPVFWEDFTKKCAAKAAHFLNRAKIGHSAGNNSYSYTGHFLKTPKHPLFFRSAPATPSRTSQSPFSPPFRPPLRLSGSGDTPPGKPGITFSCRRWSFWPLSELQL